MDKDLTPVERALALIAIELGEIISIDPTPNTGIWVEDLIPPMSENDVLSSTLCTEPGGEPQSGFNLWKGEDLYRVTIRKLDRQ